jgi:vacuolar iron transporter family protein
MSSPDPQATAPERALEPGADACDLARFTRNFLAERDSAALYEALAAVERDARQRRIYLDLAASERIHARYWENRLRLGGGRLPPHSVSLRAKLLAQLARWFGSGFVIPTITVRELKDQADYARQSDAAAAGLAAEERGHADTLRELTGVAIGTKLRAAVLGANDGLVSNFCLMMGVVGGGAKASAVVLSGIAGLVGGALSMALGEWLSVTNARELATSRRPLEPAGAIERGAAAAREAAGEAWHAARYSFCLFAAGAAVPLIPFAISGARLAVAASIAISAAALFAIGLATSLFNGRAAGFSALRQTVIGVAAAVATYGIGRLVGAIAG